MYTEKKIKENRMRLKSAKDLDALRKEASGRMSLRGDKKRIQIVVHMGTCGIASGAREILNMFAQEIDTNGIDTVTLRQSGCIGLCDQEPVCTLQDGAGNEYRYGRLTTGKVGEIVREHVLKGNPVIDYIITQ
jgi:NADP-reducing hydrogenase subunit HndB